MSTYNKDLNYQLTQHNQRMRMELCNYRSEMIKLRQELLKQREENAVLKTSLTSEFLKVSQSFNIIFRLLENTCNDSMDDTLKSINNSLSKLNNTDYVEDISKNDATIKNNGRDSNELASSISKDTSSIDDLSNFSFDVDTEEGIAIAEPISMNIPEKESESNLDLQNDENVREESSFEESAMPIIEEETEESQLESSILFNKHNLEKEQRLVAVDMNICEMGTPQKKHVNFVKNIQTQSCSDKSDMAISLEESNSNQIESPVQSKKFAFRETIIHNDSTIIEDSFKVTSTPAQRRSTNERKPSLETLSPSKIPLRNCSVLLHPINKISLEISQLKRSSTSKLSTTSVILKKEKLSINSKENVECISDSDIKKDITNKPPVRRLPGRKAAPKVLTERNIMSKLRRN